MKKIRYNINGDTWTLTVHPDFIFNKLHGEMNEAITMDEKLQIDFKQSVFNLTVVMHELFHAHSKYLYLNSATIDMNNLEEIYAEMISDRIDLFKKQSLGIYNKLKGKRNGRKKT